MPANRPFLSRWLAQSAGSAAAVQYALLLTLAGGMLLPSIAAWSLLFYLTMVPAVLWRLCAGWRPNWRSPPLIALLCLWFWSTLAIAWDHNVSHHGASPGYWLRNALCTLVFLAGFLMAQEAAGMRQRIVSTLLASAAANAVLSLALLAAQSQIAARPGFWGVTHNPTLGAAIMDVCVLLAGAQAAAKQRWAYAALLPCALYVLFSAGRAALAALAAAVAVLSLGASAWLVALCGSLAAAAAGLAWHISPGLRHELTIDLAGRGTDCHGLIWRTAWQQIMRHPLLGYGPSARLPITGGGYCPAYPAPHDLYLALLYYSGGIGLALFALLLALLWRHVRLAVPPGAGRRFWLAMACIPAIAGVSDLSQIIKGPAPIWYILWLPVLLALTLPVARPEPSTAS